MHATKKKGGKQIVLQGIGVSPGVIIGPAFLVAPESMPIEERTISADEVEHEICRLEDALIETRRQIKALQEDLEERMGLSDASILDAHLMVLDDRAFIEEVVENIRNKRVNVELVVKEVVDRYAGVLASAGDDYLRERVADVRDVARRIIRNLSGDSVSPSAEWPQNHIVVATDLAPSKTATFRKDRIIGFATDFGSPTSHTAVMARGLNIPAIVGLRNVTEHVATGDELLIDGNKGVLIIHPTAARLKKYGKVAEARRNIERGLTNLKLKPAETKDGHGIVLSANVEGLEEVDAVIECGAEGIGLFRSEYLFMARDRLVSEEEQAEVYKEVAARLAPAPAIIRTLDLGGDKYLPHQQFPREMNPFLGCRSIRLSLLHPNEFKIQLRAILRANAAGNVKIMYPMISNVDEVIQANELLEEAKAELSALGTPFQKDIDVGIMIEIPCAALTADTMAEHVDFFSIGTNDLVQYTLAVDRANERVAYLYEPTHPAVLKLIKQTIDAGHRRNIWVGLCGEMAAAPIITPLLVGMGLDELSVAPSAVLPVKDAIRSIEYSRAKELAELSLSCKSAAEVLAHCRKLTKEVAPELLEIA